MLCPQCCKEMGEVKPDHWACSGCGERLQQFNIYSIQESATNYTKGVGLDEKSGQGNCKGVF